MNLSNSGFVDVKRHRWNEGDFAIVLRYLSGYPGTKSRWTVVEQRATRDRDGILRWHDSHVLHNGFEGTLEEGGIPTGITIVNTADMTRQASYTRACVEATKQSKRLGVKVPIYCPITSNSERCILPETMLIAQWKHGEFVNNEENHILRTLKEDI